MSDTKTLKRAGDIELKSVTVVSTSGVVHDISPQVLSIELVENIFEPFTTGTITVNDAIDLTNLFPLVGNELAMMEFNTPTFADEYGYKRTFYIYNCSDKIKANERSAIYQLRIISVEAIIDKARRISRTFRGAPEEIVRSLVYEVGWNSSKNLLVENTTNDITFISNWWTPTKCLRYVASRAVNNNDSATYLFYETNGGFTFTSLDKLITAGVHQKFNVNDYNNQPAEKINSTTAVNIERDYQSVLQIEYKNGFDHFKRMETGYYGGEVIAFDGDTQQYIHSRAGKDFEDENHLNQYSPVPLQNTFGATSGFIQYIPYITQNFTGQNRGLMDTDIPYRTARQQYFSRLQTSQATIKVYGRCDYFPGMVVHLNVPKNVQLSKQDTVVYDQLTSGNYLVTSIKHIITNVRHTMILQLMKDSYVVDVNKSAYNTSTNNSTNDVVQPSGN